MNSVIDVYHNQLEKIDRLPVFNNTNLGKTKDSLRLLIGKRITEDFEKLQLGEEQVGKLRDIGLNLLVKNSFPFGYSGIVITGFGKNDTYPIAHEYHIDFKFGSYLKILTEKKLKYLVVTMPQFCHLPKEKWYIPS